MMARVFVLETNTSNSFQTCTLQGPYIAV